MTDEEPFLASIDEAKYPWPPMLVYSDWLEERGRSKEALNIRLAHSTAMILASPDDLELRRSHAYLLRGSNLTWHAAFIEEQCKPIDARSIGREYIAFGHVLFSGGFRMPHWVMVITENEFKRHREASAQVAMLRNGFVEEIAINASAFFVEGLDLSFFAENPIRKVHLHGWPMQTWGGIRPWRAPDILAAPFMFGSSWVTEAQARDAISRECIAYAHRKIGVKL